MSFFLLHTHKTKCLWIKRPDHYSNIIFGTNQKQLTEHNGVTPSCTPSLLLQTTHSNKLFCDGDSCSPPNLQSNITIKYNIQLFFFSKCQPKFSLRIHRGYSHPLAYTYHCFLPLPGQRNTTSSPETHFWNLLPETNSCTNLHVCSVSFEGGGKEGKDKCELSRRSLAFLLNVCPFDISLLTRFACCIKDFSSRKQFLIWPYSNVLD